MNPSYSQYERDVDIDGISPVEDPYLITQLKMRIARFAHAQPNVGGLPVNWPFQLSRANIHHLEAEPYVVSPKPFGMRYLIYIDSEGKIFLENNSRRLPMRNMFKLDQDRSLQLIPADTVLDGFLTRKILRNVADQNNQDWSKGKLTFIIMDAIRCKGVDLTQNNIQERIAEIQREVMEPRLEGIKNGTIQVDQEVFGLDIAEYVDTSLFEENYLTEEFKGSYDYLLRSFIFHPRKKSYVCGNTEWIFQWEEDPIQALKEFSFRLRIPDETGSTGDLCVSEGSKRKEVKYTTIELTDELRNLDGFIIECCYVDHHWVFARKREDRSEDRLPIHAERFSHHLSIEEKLTALENPVTREILLNHLGKSK